MERKRGDHERALESAREKLSSGGPFVVPRRRSLHLASHLGGRLVESFGTRAGQAARPFLFSALPRPVLFAFLVVVVCTERNCCLCAGFPLESFVFGLWRAIDGLQTGIGAVGPLEPCSRRGPDRVPPAALLGGGESSIRSLPGRIRGSLDEATQARAACAVTEAARKPDAAHLALRPEAARPSSSWPSPTPPDRQPGTVTPNDARYLLAPARFAGHGIE